MLGVFPPILTLSFTLACDLLRPVFRGGDLAGDFLEGSSSLGSSTRLSFRVFLASPFPGNSPAF